MRTAAQMSTDTSQSLGWTQPEGRYHGGRRFRRGPRVKVTAEGPRNPAIIVSTVAATMPATPYRWSRCQICGAYEGVVSLSVTRPLRVVIDATA
jgi:hypothetical protein